MKWCGLYGVEVMQWEYKVDVIAADELTSAEVEGSYLNEMGYEGWELVNTLVCEKGTRWNCWKTKPMFAARKSARRSADKL